MLGHVGAHQGAHLSRSSQRTGGPAHLDTHAAPHVCPRASSRRLSRIQEAGANMLCCARRRPTRAPTRGPEDPDGDGKAVALSNTIKELQLKHGKGSIMRLGDTEVEPVQTFSSGSLVLDAALGGGIPKGRIVEIFGPESSGKTTVALHGIAEMQKSGGVACLIDAEHAFNPKYAANMGVNVPDLFLCQPDSGEHAMEVIDELARSEAVGLVVVDSVSALVPRAELEGDIGAPGVGLQARLLSQALRKLVGSAAKGGCTVIFINQLRYKVGVMYGNPETTSGGNSLKFYSSVRIDVRKKESIGSESNNGHVNGIKVRCKVVKNKVAPPFRECMIDIMFDSGIDSMGGLLDAAEAAGVVHRKGSYYYYGEQRLGQGRERVIEFVRSDEKLTEQLESATRAALGSTPSLLDQLGDGADVEAEPGEEDDEDMDEEFRIAAEEEERRSGLAPSS